MLLLLLLLWSHICYGQLLQQAFQNVVVAMNALVLGFVVNVFAFIVSVGVVVIVAYATNSIRISQQKQPT